MLFDVDEFHFLHVVVVVVVGYAALCFMSDNFLVMMLSNSLSKFDRN